MKYNIQHNCKSLWEYSTGHFNRKTWLPRCILVTGCRMLSDMEDILHSFMIKRIDTGVEASTLLNDLLLMHKIFTCVLPCCWMCVHFTTDCLEVGCIMWERIEWSFIPSQCRSFPLHKNIFHLCWKKKHPDCHLVLKDNLSNYWVILSVFLRLSAAVLHACIRVKRKYVQINSCV